MSMEIPTTQNLQERVFAVSNEKAFEQIALDVFSFQYHHNPVYQSFCSAIHKTPGRVEKISDIPFLPIQFFKSHEVVSGKFEPPLIFRSSGTTGAATSRHLVKDLALYERSFLTCFQQFFGSPQQFCILGLLPSYLEQGQS